MGPRDLSRGMARRVGLIVTDVCLTGEENLVTKSLERYFPTRTYGTVTRRGKFLTPAAARYLDMLKQHYVTDAAEPSAAARKPAR